MPWFCCKQLNNLKQNETKNNKHPPSNRIRNIIHCIKYLYLFHEQYE